MNNEQQTTNLPTGQAGNQQRISCFRVGITGGIGSGKSLVCSIFETFGIPVYYADARAKWLMNNDLELKKGVVEIFGKEAYAADGKYNRSFVASVAFSHPEKLAALNALVHPAVERDSLVWHLAQADSGTPYTLKEAALMIESGSYKHLDFLIVVAAPEDLRIQRVMQRDGATEEQVLARMKHQLSEDEKVKLANFIISNDGEKLLIPQVWRVHREILKRRED